MLTSRRTTDTITATTTTTTTATITPTNTGLGDGAPQKRAVSQQKSPYVRCHGAKEPPFSACKSASKYSSACSCIGVKTTTITAATPTTTKKTTTTVSTTKTSTVKSTVTTSVTITHTTTNTDTNVATTTIFDAGISITTTTTTTSITVTTQSVSTTSVLLQSTCSQVYAFGVLYYSQYVGSNTLSPDNPANNPDAIPEPQITTISGSQDVCTAVQICANFAQQGVSAIGGEYYTFNLQFREATQDWNCVAYYDIADGEYYTVTDPNVKYSYGYAG